MDFSQLTHEEIESRKAAILELLKDDNCDIDALTEEVNALEERDNQIKKQAEERKALIEEVNAGAGAIVEERKEETKMNDLEVRANDFQAKGITKRSILASGKIAQPTQVGGIENIGALVGSIVDDVTAVSVNGNGTYRVAYEKTNAAAAGVTEGAAFAGTEAAYDYVDIAPETWGVISEVSNLIKDTTPLNYLGAVEQSSLIGLRKLAADKIVASLSTSTLATAKTVALDADYIKNLLLNLEARPELGAMKLYIDRASLIKLAALRGTNEKKAVYNIEFKDSMNGVISEGGVGCEFSIINTTATQYFGQPKGIQLAMWGDYEIATDEGGKYFEKNMIGVRGKAVAGAGLCAPVFFKVTQQ